MIRDETERRPLVITVRLPDAIKTWIEEKAVQDERSQNAVIVRALRARMDQEQRKKAAG
jgi:predicted transcriptional regulator